IACLKSFVELIEGVTITRIRIPEKAGIVPHLGHARICAEVAVKLPLRDAIYVCVVTTPFVRQLLCVAQVRGERVAYRGGPRIAVRGGGVFAKESWGGGNKIAWRRGVGLKCGGGKRVISNIWNGVDGVAAERPASSIVAGCPYILACLVHVSSIGRIRIAGRRNSHADAATAKSAVRPVRHVAHHKGIRTQRLVGPVDAIARVRGIELIGGGVPPGYDDLVVKDRQPDLAVGVAV